ncbi:hypothetical protein Pan44_23280 [Caulifigura coniformis]|uniref:Uncharacterized protein n=1 Tax=Caulifigura coniformis TaxID=2527983 RepID=A0A517SDU9_9PLAN|nr:hypothetical protein Pan44_23280 [Caulifigura coniformis]
MNTTTHNPFNAQSRPANCAEASASRSRTPQSACVRSRNAPSNGATRSPCPNAAGKKGNSNAPPPATVRLAPGAPCDARASPENVPEFPISRDPGIPFLIFGTGRFRLDIG